MREHALVEALEARRQKGQPLLACELLDHVLRQLPALRRQRDDSMSGRVAVGRLERGRNDIDAEHHPGSAAVGLVVDLRSGERCVVAVAEQAQVQLVAEHGRNGPLLRQPRKGLRDQGEDVELQRRRCSG